MDRLHGARSRRAQQQGDAADALMPEAAARYVVACLVEALAAMHQRGVVHLDVKPSSVLIYGDCVRLTDFNHSLELDAAWGLTPARVTAKRGTQGYQASRRIQASEAHAGQPCGPPADVYSLGVTLAYMLGGPVRMHLKGLGLPAGVSRDAQSLVEAMMRGEPAQRLTLHGVRSHPWLAGFDWQALCAGSMPLPAPLVV